MAGWQPFAKGNNLGGGRPKKTDEMRKAETLMREKSEAGARDLIDLSEKSPDDNVRARLLMFRWEAVFGKATQAITGADGEPLLPTVDLSRLTDDQLRAVVAAGRVVIAGPDDGSSGGDGVGETGSGEVPP